MPEAFPSHIARRSLLVFAGAVAIVLATVSLAWACSTPDTDMELSNKNSPNKGQNFTSCSVSDYLDHNLGGNDCTREVEVHGTDFVNQDDSQISSVDLYWMDGPLFLTAVGGSAEPVSGPACEEGRQVASGVDVQNGEFTETVSVPPPGLAVYGGNAVCAVWEHADHTAGLGNQYNIFP